MGEVHATVGGGDGAGGDEAAEGHGEVVEVGVDDIELCRAEIDFAEHLEVQPW